MDINRIKVGIQKALDRLTGKINDEKYFHAYNKDLSKLKDNKIFKLHRSKIKKEKERFEELNVHASLCLKISEGSHSNFKRKQDIRIHFPDWLLANFQIFSLLLKAMYQYKIITTELKNPSDPETTFKDFPFCWANKLLVSRMKFSKKYNKEILVPNFVDSEKWESYNLIEHDNKDFRILGFIVYQVLSISTNPIKHLSTRSFNTGLKGTSMDDSGYKTRLKLRTNKLTQSIYIDQLREALVIINKTFSAHGI